MAVVRRVSPRTGRVTWRAAVHYIGDDGRDHVRRIDADSRAEAKRLEAGLLRERESGKIAPSRSRVTFGSYLEDWRGTRTGLRPNTVSSYKQMISNVTRIIGGVDLRKLSPLDIVRLYSELRAGGMADSTLKQHHMLLRYALETAKRWRLVPFNIMDDVETPRVPKRTVLVLTIDELRRVYAVADELDRERAVFTDIDATPLGTLIRTLAYTGMRIGEALALTWADVEDGGSTLVVRYSKTGVPRRVGIPTEIIDLIDVLSRRRDHLFPWKYTTIRDLWRAIRKRAGVERATLHSLRHAHASHLLASGAPVPVVAARLGHDPKTLISIYAHALPAQDQALALEAGRVMR